MMIRGPTQATPETFLYIPNSAGINAFLEGNPGPLNFGEQVEGAIKKRRGKRNA